MLSESNISHAKRCTIHFLPEEILFHILILLPADTLYNVVRYVCRQWYGIVQDPKFLSAHFLLSTTTLLRRTRYQTLPCGDWVNKYRLLDVKDSCANVTHFKFVLSDHMKVHSTCNGLLLMRGILQTAYYVGNPITRKLLALPRLSYSMSPYWSGLAVSASSGLYKVVVTYHYERLYCDGRCAIFTVGVDEAWRFLDFRYLNLQPNFFLNGNQVVISGYVYCIPKNEKGVIYALDVDTEIMKRIAVPYHDTGNKHFLPKGNSILFLIYYPDFSVEGWVLKDTKSKAWVKFGPIEGEPMRNQWVNILSHYKRSTLLEFIDDVRPIFWLENGEKILFGVQYLSCEYRFIVYDLNTHACSEFDKKCEFVPFMTSLAWV